VRCAHPTGRVVRILLESNFPGILSLVPHLRLNLRPAADKGAGRTRAAMAQRRAAREDRFMSQATLYSHRITLVPLSDEHLEHEVELDADPEVMRYLGDGKARSREDVEEFHRRRLAAAARVPGLGFWAGFVAGRFVGWWILEPAVHAAQSPVGGQAELGYRILRRCWRQGLASEGARELIRHGFDELGLARIFAETMTVNTASRATMACLGMTYVRTFHLDCDAPIPGAEHGEVEYAITRDRWIADAVARSPRQPKPE
jgi:RimJ/RimL family protein N-acetyltransferase